MNCQQNLNTSKVQTILVLAYRVLANAGRYWSEPGIGYFLLWNPIPISAH